LWASFRSAEDATRFVRTLDRPARYAGRYVLVEADSIRPRLGYWVQRNGGVAHVIGGERIRLVVTFWSEKRNGPKLDAIELTAQLQGQVRAFIEPHAAVQLEQAWQAVSGAFDTAQPAELLSALVDFARARDLAVSMDAQPCDRIVDTMARLADDLALASRTLR
jgi:hypothetical protein